MGLYVEPEDGNKKIWFIENSGYYLTTDPKFAMASEDELWVCYVDNGSFEALGVAFDEQEFNRFNNPEDERMKVWATVKKSKLRKVCPQWKDYIDDPKWYKYIQWGKNLTRWLLPPLILVGIVYLFLNAIVMYELSFMVGLLVFLAMLGINEVFNEFSPSWKKLKSWGR